jgi:hypothetical protein
MGSAFVSVQQAFGATKPGELIVLIDHSVPVAEKVKEYVDTMVRLDAESSEDDESRRFSLVSNRLSFAQEGSGNRA